MNNSATLDVSALFALAILYDPTHAVGIIRQMRSKQLNLLEKQTQ